MEHGNIPITHPEDFELARRCLAAEPAALREFSRRSRPVAMAAMASVGITDSNADDVVQRLFIRLLVASEDRPARLSTYEGRGSLMSWVRTCALRSALMVRRAAQSRPEQIDEFPVLADPRPDPESRLTEEQAKRQLEVAFGRVVAGLDPRERNLLRYCAPGTDQGQVAKTYGVHRATVSRWFDRLRTKLRKRTLRTLADEATPRGPSSSRRNLPNDLDVHVLEVLDRSFEPEAAAAGTRY